MCGISGLIDFSRSQSAEALSVLAGKMADAARHRGPDGNGVCRDPNFGAAFGHRRLSIIDPSSHGHQPMAPACGGYVITCNGEIVNFAAPRRELEQLGHGFGGHSATEVLMASLSQTASNGRENPDGNTGKAAIIPGAGMGQVQSTQGPTDEGIR